MKLMILLGLTLMVIGGFTWMLTDPIIRRSSAAMALIILTIGSLVGSWYYAYKTIEPPHRTEKELALAARITAKQSESRCETTTYRTRVDEYSPWHQQVHRDCWW